MANVDAPHGFKAVRSLSGGCPVTFQMAVAAANGAFEQGDLLVIDTTGFVTGRSAASPASGTVCGVAVHGKAASAGGQVLVYSPYDTVFEGQTDNGTGTATAQACIGTNINIINTAPSGGVSQQELDESSAAVTSTLPFKVIGLFKAVDNAFGEFNRLEVVLNRSCLMGGGDGATGI